MVFALSTLAVFLQDLKLLTLVLLVGVGLTYLMGGNFNFLKKFKRIMWLFVGIAIIQSIFSPQGTVLFSVGEFSILTIGGLEKGVRFFLRILAIIIPATIMGSSSTREIIQALVQWKISYEIAFMVSLAIRFLPLLGEEVKDTFIAIQLRGIELDKIPLGKRIKIYSYLLMPILSGVILKAREISTAMETRAFRAYPTRTSYINLKLRRIDYMVMFLSVLFVFFIISMNYVF